MICVDADLIYHLSTADSTSPFGLCFFGPQPVYEDVPGSLSSAVRGMECQFASPPVIPNPATLLEDDRSLHGTIVAHFAGLPTFGIPRLTKKPAFAGFSESERGESNPRHKLGKPLTDFYFLSPVFVT
jgi:hypothetical protein